MFNFQWTILRLSALLVFLGLLIDMEMVLLIFGFLLLHISLGLKKMVFDYIHVKKIKFISSMLISISLIEMTSYVLELLM